MLSIDRVGVGQQGFDGYVARGEEIVVDADVYIPLRGSVLGLMLTMS